MLTNRRPKTRKGERGQMLILFVGIFTVTMGLAAFAIDQGVYLSKRRESQKDADTAARAGAMAYLADPAALAEAELRAQDTADANGVDVSGATDTTFTASGDCVDFRGVTVDDVPSIHVEINAPTSSLFGRVFGIDGLQDLGAQATACTGEPDGLQGIDPFYVAPGAAGPDLKCFNADGTPKLGSICPIVVSSGYQDQGSRGNLTLQFDPDASNVDPGCDVFTKSSCETKCTEGNANATDEQIVTGSRAICLRNDGVYTKGGTLNNVKGAVYCRIFGVAHPECSNKLDDLDQPGEGFCDDAFNDPTATVPPFDGAGLTPAFPPADVIDSPANVDDFTEAFVKLNGDPPDSYTGSESLLPNLCSGRPSPRIWTIIIGKTPPVNGRMVVDQFATFFVLGCWNLAPGQSDTFIGSIDPYCNPINASITNLVGVFVNAFLPKGGGTIAPCDPDDGCVGQTIILVK